MRKLEKFPVKRISIKNGKFMVFFVNQSINELNDVGPKRGGNPQADTRDSFNSDNTYTTGYSETGSYYT